MRQDMSLHDTQKYAEGLFGALKSYECKIIGYKYWGIKPLAHIVRKNKKGHYVYFGLDGSPDAVKELKRKCRISEMILRSMILKTNKISELVFNEEESDNKEGQDDK